MFIKIWCIHYIIFTAVPRAILYTRVYRISGFTIKSSPCTKHTSTFYTAAQCTRLHDIYDPLAATPKSIPFPVGYGLSSHTTVSFWAAQRQKTSTACLDVYLTFRRGALDALLTDVSSARQLVDACATPLYLYID